MLSAVFIALVVGVVIAQDTTTHRPHNTHPPAVHENYMFQYFSSAHQLVVKSTTTCYIMTLTADQQQSVHSPTGLHTLESQLILAVDKTSTHVKVDFASLDTHVAHFCTHNQHHMPVFSVS